MWHVWEKRNTYLVYVRKPEGRKQLGRHRCRWYGIVKIDYKGTESGGVD
jgi:hypothetical protein